MSQHTFQPAKRAQGQSRRDGRRGGAPGRRPSLAIALMAALGVSCLAGWASLAMWADQATQAAIVTAGDLNIKATSLSWYSPTLLVGGGDAASLAELVVRDGDIVVISQSLETSFTGDNLQVELGLAWPGLPSETTATWHVQDCASQLTPPVGEASLATKLRIDTLASQGCATWQVVVTVQMPAGTSIYVDPSSTPQATSWPIGALTITATQVRQAS